MTARPETPGRALGCAVDISAEGTSDRASGRGSRWRVRSRWLVHLGLLVTAAAALGTLQLLHVRTAIHTDVGLVFGGLVVVHLFQRRVTIARMAGRLTRLRTAVERTLRLAASDLVLLFLTVNVIVSGVLDWGRGSPIGFPLPRPFSRWHLDASMALVAYLAVHVLRRRKRLRRSTIR